MKNIKRTILIQTLGSEQAQKAVALAIMLKNISGNSSVFYRFTINKMHIATRLSATALKKYIAILKQMGLVEVKQRKGKQMLIVKKMVSSCSHRNFNLPDIDCDCFKEIYSQVRAMAVVIAQSRLDFVRRTLQQRENPRNLKELKRARRLCKRYGYDKFTENGISYKRLAQLIGCSIATAIKVVKDAIQRRWIAKINHYSKVLMKGVHFREIEGYTFTTKNYGYKVGANTYSILLPITASFNTGIY